MPKSTRIDLPHRLAPGAKVMLFAPAGAVGPDDNVDEAVEKLRNLDLEVEIAPHLRSRYGYLAGTDEERAQDVNEAFSRADIAGLVAIRGGYGCARILPHLDFDLIRKNPKVVTGYSDLTALHLGLLAKTGLITFHGPVAGSTFTDFSRASWIATLREPQKDCVLPNVSSGSPPRTLESRHRGKSATGRMVGGNLSVFVSLFGTPFMPKLDGAILFFEDVHEEPYRIDRMLTQLRLAGVFERAAGLVFGRFTNTEPRDGSPLRDWDLDFVLQERSRDLPIPVVAGFPVGHVKEQHTIAHGARYRLDPSNATLTMLTPAVR